MNDLIKQPVTDLENRDIEKRIYSIRGKQVMLDSDIAHLFRVESRIINQQMKRNKVRFPEDFCFQLSKAELHSILRSQNVISNLLSSKRRYNPYVYTEHGVIALAGVLKNETAAKMSVEIARAFIQMRRFILENGDTLLALAKLQNRQLEFENETNRKFDEIIKYINRSNLPKEAVFYAGKFFDAFELVSSLVAKANQSIILIDSYCDSKALSFLKSKGKDVKLTIIKGPHSKLGKEEVSQYEQQYGEVAVVEQDDIHDRFLIIDNKECYSLGASLNHMGSKLFAIIKTEDQKTIDSIVGSLKTR